MSLKNSKQKRRTPHRIPRKIPPVGTELVGRFRGNEYYATVIVAPSFPEGKGIRVGDTVYGSLSAAAKAIKGWPTNGWLFWKPK